MNFNTILQDQEGKQTIIQKIRDNKAKSKSKAISPQFSFNLGQIGAVKSGGSPAETNLPSLSIGNPNGKQRQTVIYSNYRMPPQQFAENTSEDGYDTRFNSLNSSQINPEAAFLAGKEPEGSSRRWKDANSEVRLRPPVQKQMSQNQMFTKLGQSPSGQPQMSWGRPSSPGCDPADEVLRNSSKRLTYGGPQLYMSKNLSYGGGGTSPPDSQHTTPRKKSSSVLKIKHLLGTSSRSLNLKPPPSAAYDKQPGLALDSNEPEEPVRKSLLQTIKFAFRNLVKKKSTASETLEPIRDSISSAAGAPSEKSTSQMDKKKERVLKSVIAKLSAKKESKNQSDDLGTVKEYKQIDIMQEEEATPKHSPNVFKLDNGQIKAKASKLPLRAENLAKLAWNMVVILSAVAVGFVVPISTAFGVFAGSVYVEVWAHFAFTIDILLTSCTSFYHPETGDVVRNLAAIRKYYFTSIGFILDFAAAFPLHLLWSPSMFNFKLLLLLKLLRMQPSLSLGFKSEKAKLTMKIINLFVYLLFYIHITACLFYFAIAADQVWVPRTNRFQAADFYESDPIEKYLVCIHTSILLLMGNDIVPESSWLDALCCVLLVFGALIIANIFGTITVVVSTLNRRAQKFQDKIDMANTSMANMKLPASIQQDIREFMMSTHSNLDTQKELDSFMQMVSPSLRNKVTKHIFINAIASNPVLHGSEEIIDFLINDVAILLYQPEDHIVTQGEQGDSLYLIAAGNCSVSVMDHMRASRFVRQLNQGEHFGEVSILYETPRTATVKSSNYCTLASLSRKTFFDLCNNFPQIIIRMRQRTLDYKDPWKQFKHKVLSQIEYFREAAESHPFLLDEISYHLQDEYLEPGSEIIGPDCPLQQLTLVVQGLVDLVVFDQEGNEVLLDTLGQGDVIGHYSVLFDETPIFSAVAKTRVRILTLSQEFFLENQETIDGLDEAIYNCEDLVEISGIPLCDYQKFFRRDSLKAKMLRAKRKAHILENSLLISKSLNSKSRGSPARKKDSKLDLRQFSTQKRHSIRKNKGEPQSARRRKRQLKKTTSFISQRSAKSGLKKKPTEAFQRRRQTIVHANAGSFRNQMSEFHKQQLAKKQNPLGVLLNVPEVPEQNSVASSSSSDSSSSSQTSSSSLSSSSSTSSQSLSSSNESIDKQSPESPELLYPKSGIFNLKKQQTSQTQVRRSIEHKEQKKKKKSSKKRIGEFKLEVRQLEEDDNKKSGLADLVVSARRAQTMLDQAQNNQDDSKHLIEDLVDTPDEVPGPGGMESPDQLGENSDGEGDDKFKLCFKSHSTFSDAEAEEEQDTPIFDRGQKPSIKTLTPIVIGTQQSMAARRMKSHIQKSLLPPPSHRKTGSIIDTTSERSWETIKRRLTSRLYLEQGSNQNNQSLGTCSPVSRHMILDVRNIDQARRFQKRLKNKK